jgi:hypothetical protein
MIEWNSEELIALDGKFIFKDIRAHILANTIGRIVYDTPLLLFTTYVFSNSAGDNGIETVRQTMIERALDFQVRSNNQHKRMIIYWFPTHFKKQFPISSKYSLDTEEINSATTFHYPANFISIFRLEEAPKVLIHELAHYFELDAILRSSDFGYTKQFDLNVPCLLCETYSEMIAFFVNLEYVSKKTGADLRTLYFMERAFSIIQVKKIIDFFHISNLNQFHKLKSNTNLFTYYFLKTAILLVIDDPIAFIRALENERFVLKSTSHFKFLIDSGLHQLFKQIAGLPEIPIEFKKTMRMTIIE